MKILITGGSGFVGSNLITKLKSNSNYEYLSIDKKDSQMHHNITELVNIVKKEDLNRIDFIPNTIVHLAAEHRDDITPKSLYYDVNVTGTKNIIDLAKLKSVNSIIFFSSVAVYGFAELGTNEHGKINPFNEYGKTKHQAEIMLEKWYEENPNDRKLIIIRPTVIFGPRNRGNFYNLINQINQNKFLMVGNGKNIKSLAYISNVVDFVIHALNFKNGRYLFNYIDKPDSNMNEIVKTIYSSFNKKRIPIKVPFFLAFYIAKLIDLISHILKRKFPISSIRIKKFCSDTSFNTSIDETGFIPKYSIDDSIKETINYEFNDDNKDDVIFYTE